MSIKGLFGIQTALELSCGMNFVPSVMLDMWSRCLRSTCKGVGYRKMTSASECRELHSGLGSGKR